MLPVSNAPPIAAQRLSQLEAFVDLVATQRRATADSANAGHEENAAWLRSEAYRLGALVDEEIIRIRNGRLYGS